MPLPLFNNEYASIFRHAFIISLPFTPPCHHYHISSAEYLPAYHATPSFIGHYRLHTSLLRYYYAALVALDTPYFRIPCHFMPLLHSITYAATSITAGLQVNITPISIFHITTTPSPFTSTPSRHYQYVTVTNITPLNINGYWAAVTRSLPEDSYDNTGLVNVRPFGRHRHWPLSSSSSRFPSSSPISLCHAAKVLPQASSLSISTGSSSVVTSPPGHHRGINAVTTPPVIAASQQAFTTEAHRLRLVVTSLRLPSHTPRRSIAFFRYAWLAAIICRLNTNICY